MRRFKPFNASSRLGLVPLLMLLAALIAGAGDSAAIGLDLPGCDTLVEVTDRPTTQTNTPVIIFPPRDGFVRGDSLCTNYFIWKIQTQPTFQYILAINKIDGPGGQPLPGLDAIVRSIPRAQALAVPGQSNMRYIVFDYNTELEDLGSGFYRAGLAAVGDAGVFVAGPVEFRKGTSIGTIAMEPTQCDPTRIDFDLTVEDPDSTPPYEYTIRFTSLSGAPTVGPFVVTSSNLSLTRADFPDGFESQFVPGTEYTMEMVIRDDIDNPNSPVSIGQSTFATFHVNSAPEVTAVSSPQRVETVFGGSTFVNDFSVTATDIDGEQLTVRISVSRDNAPFIPLTTRTMASNSTAVFSVDVNGIAQLPPPANGVYLFQVQVFDGCNAGSDLAPSNLAFTTTFISDTPAIQAISPTNEGFGPDGAGLRFDFPLLQTFPNFGRVSALINYPSATYTNVFHNPVTFRWEFTDLGQFPSQTSDLEFAEHLYDGAQRTTTGLTLTDTLGFTTSRTFDLIINDIPKVEVITVGNAQLTAPNTWTIRRGDPAIFIATAYNYVAGDNNAITFDWLTTGTTTVPIIYPALVQENPVPDFPGGPLVASAQAVPAGRGPIVDVDVLNLTTQQRFTEPAADLCANAAPLTNSTFPVDPTVGGIEGSSTLDDILFAAVDTVTGSQPAPPVAPELIYTVDTSDADASFTSPCDEDPLPPQTEACDVSGMSLNTPALVSLGSALPINTQGATLDGTTLCDVDLIPSALDACSPAAQSINPPTALAINTFGMSPFDGYSTCDLDINPSATDTCNESAISIFTPALLPVNTAGAVLDGESTADLDDFGAPSDLCVTAPAIGPSLNTLAINPAGSTPSIGLISACGDIPLASDFCTSAPQATSGQLLPINTLYSVVGLLGNEASGLCDIETASPAFANICGATSGSLFVGTFPASTVGFDLDTYYDANGGSILPAADFCEDAPPLIPGTFVISTDGATSSTGLSAANILTPGDPTDSFAAAPAIRPGQAYSFAINDNDPLDEADCDPNNLDFDRYYLYTPATSGLASFSFNATPANADKMISIHPAGAAASSTNTLACDTESTNGDSADLIDFAVTGGTSYLIRLAGSQDGQYELNFTGPEPFVDVFYAYTPSSDGPASFVISDVAPGATISAHTGCPATDLNDTVSSSAAVNTTSITLNVTSDTTYIIRVGTPLEDPTIGLEVTGPDTQIDGYFIYTPAQSGPVQFALTSSPDHAVLSLHADACPIGVAIAVSETSNSQQAEITANVVAGTTYKVRIATPKEDPDTQLVVSGVDSRVDLYYTYIPSADGIATVSGLGFANGESVTVYEGCGGVEVACAGEFLGTLLTDPFPVVAGVTYSIRFSTDLESGTGNLLITGPDAVGRPRNDVWYAYTPRLDGVATVTLDDSATDTLLAIYDACGGTELECSVTTLADQASVTFAVTAFQTYRIRLASVPGAAPYGMDFSGPDQVGRPRQDVFYTYRPATAGLATVSLVGSPDDAVLSIHTDCPATQGNEVASTRTLGLTQASVSFNTVPGTTYFIRTAAPFNLGGYTYDIDVQGPLPVGRPRQDVFFKYQPRTTGPATITLSGSPAATSLSVHDDCPATATNQLDCDSTDGAQATVTFNAVANTIYYIRIAAPDNASGYQFTADVTGPPTLGRPRQDVFYNYQPRLNGPVTLRLVGSPEDTVLSVHDACPANGSNQIDCALTTDTLQAEITFNAVANTEYSIRVAAPHNNALGHQFQLEVEGPDAVGRPRQDVFYSYTPRVNGNATFNLIDSPDDSILALYTDSGTTTVLTYVACDVTNSESQASITLPVTANVRYTIRIAAPFDSQGAPFAFSMIGPDRTGRPRSDVFWTYTPATGGSATLALAASPEDTVLSVHSDCPATTVTEIVADRTTLESGQAEVTFPVTAGVAYVIRIASPEDAVAAYSLTISGPAGLGDFFSDLTATLTGAGQSAQLFSGLCPQETALAGPFALDDQAELAIGADCPPLAGESYRPEQSFDVFNELDPVGTWQLTLQDDSIRHIGTLDDWAVRISTREFAQPTNPEGTEVANSPLPIFNQAIFQTFNESGIYTFNVQTSEQFGPDTLFSEPVKITVIVLDQVGNATADWALYR